MPLPVPAQLAYLSHSVCTFLGQVIRICCPAHAVRTARACCSSVRPLAIGTGPALMSTKGPSQGREGLQKGRQRWYNNRRKQTKPPQEDSEFSQKPPKRPHAGAAAPGAAAGPAAAPKKRRQDQAWTKPGHKFNGKSAPSATPNPAAPKSAPKPAPNSAPREVLNTAVIQGPPFRYVAQVGQGTYGKVYKAIDTNTQKVYAMKRLRLESQREGLPITAAREIKLLQMLRHENVVRLNEIVVSRADIYMAFDYIEHDLAGLLLNKDLKISEGNVKSLILQTTAALAFLHARMVMHRDIKGSNILVTSDGVIKLADFGLARYVDVVRPAARYTNRVITLWYRPPELLLGADRYGLEVDEWGVGCLLVELFLRVPLFHGKDEISQLQAIYDIMGVPSVEEWPDRVNLPWVPLFDALPMQTPPHPRTLAGVLEGNPVSPACLDLITKLLALNPAKRLSAEDALQHQYFSEEPQADPLKLAFVDEWHDWEAKQRTRAASSDVQPPVQQAPAAPQPAQRQQPQPPRQEPQHHPQKPPQKPKQPRRLTTHDSRKRY